MKQQHRANVYFLTAEEGGLTIMSELSKDGYSIAWTTQQVLHCYWSVKLLFVEKQIEGGKSYDVGLSFISPIADYHFKSGDELLLYEGSRLIAQGNIL